MKYRTLRIEVTRKDLDEGTMHDGEHCPVSRAIKRRLRRGYAPWVNSEQFAINRLAPDFAQIYAGPLPREAQIVVRQVDAGRAYKVKEQRFLLVLPAEVVRR